MPAGEAGQNGDLAAGIAAIHIVAGVLRLGVAELLGQFSRASSKPMFSRFIFVSMKFVVPLTMPRMLLIWLAARHWCIGVMIGVPPPTLASNRKAALCSLARASSSAP